MLDPVPAAVPDALLAAVPDTVLLPAEVLLPAALLLGPVPLWYSTKGVRRSRMSDDASPTGALCEEGQ